MAYQKQNFIDGEVLTAEKLNHIEDGIDWDVIKPEDGVSTGDIADSAITELKINDGAVSGYYTATIGTAWSGTTAPYTQTISVIGVRSTDTPIVDLVLNNNYTTASNEIDAWGSVYRIVTGANTLTVYATDKITISLNVQIRCIRK